MVPETGWGEREFQVSHGIDSLGLPRREPLASTMGIRPSNNLPCPVTSWFARPRTIPATLVLQCRDSTQTSPSRELSRYLVSCVVSLS